MGYARKEQPRGGAQERGAGGQGARGRDGPETGCAGADRGRENTPERKKIDVVPRIGDIVRPPQSPRRRERRPAALRSLATWAFVCRRSARARAARLTNPRGPLGDAQYPRFVAPRPLFTHIWVLFARPGPFHVCLGLPSRTSGSLFAHPVLFRVLQPLSRARASSRTQKGRLASPFWVSQPAPFRRSGSVGPSEPNPQASRSYAITRMRRVSRATLRDGLLLAAEDHAGALDRQHDRQAEEQHANDQLQHVGRGDDATDDAGELRPDRHRQRG